MVITGIKKQTVEFILDRFEHFKNTYFWTPPASASSRRYTEKKNSFRYDFKVDDKPSFAELTITCSCKNFYSKRLLYIAGSRKKMMVPFLKKMLSEGTFSEE